VIREPPDVEVARAPAPVAVTIADEIRQAAKISRCVGPPRNSHHRSPFSEKTAIFPELNFARPGDARRSRAHRDSSFEFSLNGPNPRGRGSLVITAELKANYRLTRSSTCVALRHPLHANRLSFDKNKLHASRVTRNDRGQKEIDQTSS
jgi:hypothetical protein